LRYKQLLSLRRQKERKKLKLSFMKNAIVFPIVFISVCVFSTLSTNAVSAQILFKKRLTTTADTVNNDFTSFTVRIVQDEKNAEKFILLINNPFNQKLNISVRSNAGESFNETITQATLGKRFDMSDAEDGVYTVEVSNGKTTITKQIQLATKTEVTRSIAIR
jgi:hypothetical protein